MRGPLLTLLLASCVVETVPAEDTAGRGDDLACHGCEFLPETYQLEGVIHGSYSLAPIPFSRRDPLTKQVGRWVEILGNGSAGGRFGVRAEEAGSSSFRVDLTRLEPDGLDVLCFLG